MDTSTGADKTGRLTVSYHQPPQPNKVASGVQKLFYNPRKEGLLYVPQHYAPNTPAALAVMLHGSGGNPDQGLWLLRRYADKYNLLLLAPPSYKYTWDVLADRAFGPDVLYLNQALAYVFDNFVLDPSKIAIGGFSDGASYALCLGLTNGDLFTHIIAFSPGFSFSLAPKGVPSIFLSHGTQDAVLPIDRCGRAVQQELIADGRKVHYLEFRGEHEIPADVSAAAITWFMP